MNIESGKIITNNPEPALSSAPNQSRRSFAKASLLAPVILSLANRPAWGATNRCMVSGFNSVMEIGSGVLGNSDTCGYASAGDILGQLSVDSAHIINKRISTIFACEPSYNPKIGEALNAIIPNGISVDDYTVQRAKYYVMAYYNVLLYEKNAFPCPVADVFCYFENNIGSALNLGNVTLTEPEIIKFLESVFP